MLPNDTNQISKNNPQIKEIIPPIKIIDEFIKYPTYIPPEILKHWPQPKNPQQPPNNPQERPIIKR